MLLMSIMMYNYVCCLGSRYSSCRHCSRLLHLSPTLTGVLRPQMSVARVRDIDFVHPNSSKRLQLLYQRVKPKPLSQSEQVEALSELKRILPNAPIFMAGNPDSPKASMPVDSHPLDPTLAILGKVALWGLFECPAI